MPAITVFYDYVESQGQWKIVQAQDVGGKEITLVGAIPLWFSQISEIDAAVKQASHPQVPVLVQRWDPCAQDSHDLSSARFLVWSQDGMLAYVVCSCACQRRVSRQDWLAAHPEGATP